MRVPGAVANGFLSARAHLPLRSRFLFPSAPTRTMATQGAQIIDGTAVAKSVARAHARPRAR
jgi:hypothetical protein